MHPGLLQPTRHQNQQPDGKQGTKNGRGPGNDIPKAFRHQL